MSRRCHHGSKGHAPLGRVPRRPATATPERHASAPGYSAPAASVRFASPPPEPVGQPDAADPHEPIEAEIREVETVREVDTLRDSETLVESEPLVEAAAPTTPSAAVATVAPPEPEPEPEAEARPAPVPFAARTPAAMPIEARVAQPRPIESRPFERRPAPRPIAAPEPPRPHAEGDEAALERTATAPQLRRFIKSRTYVPMHELRRRFAINGGDDDVTPVDIERKRVFVGLPEREGRLLGELLRAGDIGYELSLDPISPIVVGVYPMRPVTRL